MHFKKKKKTKKKKPLKKSSSQSSGEKQFHHLKGTSVKGPLMGKQSERNQQGMVKHQGQERAENMVTPTADQAKGRNSIRTPVPSPSGRPGGVATSPEV